VDISTTHEGFLEHRWRLWIGIALVLIAWAAALAIWQPHGAWTQYELGGLAAGLIVWLIALSVRKRSYRSTLGSVKGWVSAHVYLGIALVAIAAIHARMRFGLNIHGTLFLLLLLNAATGLWGVWAYDRFPRLITANRAGATREAWLAELADVNDHCLRLADLLGPEFHQMMVISIDKLQIGGGLRQQWFGSHASDAATAKMVERARRASGAPPSASVEATLNFVAERLPSRSGDDAARLRRLLDLMTQRRELVEKINRDVTLHARMKLWLWLHLPLTAAVLAGLIAHVIVVTWFQ
jgi:hypothetical protein